MVAFLRIFALFHPLFKVFYLSESHPELSLQICETLGNIDVTEEAIKNYIYNGG